MNPVEISRGVFAGIWERLSALAGESERTVLIGTVLLASAVSAVTSFVLTQYYSVDMISSLVGGPEDCWLDWGMQLGRHCFSDFALPASFAARPNPWAPYPLFLQPIGNNYPAAGMVPQAAFALVGEWLGAPRLGLLAYLLVLTIAVLTPAFWASLGARGLERAAVFVACGAVAVPAWTVIDRGNSVGFVVPIALLFLICLRRQRWGLVAVMVVLAALVKPQFAVLVVALFAARQWRLGVIAIGGVFLSNIAAYLLWPKDFPGTIVESIRNVFEMGSYPGAFVGPYNVSFARALMSLRYSVELAWNTGSFAALGMRDGIPVDFLPLQRSLIGYAFLVLIVVSVLVLGRSISPVMAGMALLAAASLFTTVTNQYYLVFVLPIAALVVRDPDGPPGSGIFDHLNAVGDRRRAVGICVTLAAALTIAAIALPSLPMEAPHPGQRGSTGMVVTTTVWAPIAWLITCTAIIASYARRPARRSAALSSPIEHVADNDSSAAGAGHIDLTTTSAPLGLRAREIMVSGGIGGMTVVVVALFIGAGHSEPPGDQQVVRSQVAPTLDLSKCRSNTGDDKYVQCTVQAISKSVDVVWSKLMSGYHRPVVQTFSGHRETGCGPVTSDVGPFYCPVDQTAYFDTDFFQVLIDQFGTSGGRLAQEYVVGHEFGHHIQYLQGVRGRSEDAGVRTELQADCYAGVWMHHAATTQLGRTGEPYLQPLSDKDIANALFAAASVGGAIQHQAGGQFNLESWTHGSAEQRQKWFTVGYRTGDPKKCDTFAATDLEG